VTFHQARVAAATGVRRLASRGRDLAAEKREARKRTEADRVEDLLEAFITKHVSQNRSARGTSQMLGRELASWRGRSIHEIAKRDVIEVVSIVEQRGAPVAANKTLRAIKTFLRWCVGRAVLDQSPAEGIPLPTKEVARDLVLSDHELSRVIIAARQIGGPYGGIVELLALTVQRREEVARCVWDEVDLDNRVWALPNLRTKNAKSHIVHLSDQAIAVLSRASKHSTFVFSTTGDACVSNLSTGDWRIITRDGSLVSVSLSPFGVMTRTPRLMRAIRPSSCVTRSRAKREASSTMTVRTPLPSMRSSKAEKPGRVSMGRRRTPRGH
jgi:integrase